MKFVFKFEAKGDFSFLKEVSKDSGVSRYLLHLISEAFNTLRISVSSVFYADEAKKSVFSESHQLTENLLLMKEMTIELWRNFYVNNFLVYHRGFKLYRCFFNEFIIECYLNFSEMEALF